MASGFSNDQNMKMKGTLRISCECSKGSVEHLKWLKKNSKEEIQLDGQTTTCDNGQELELADVTLDDEDKYACTLGDTKIEFSVKAEVSGVRRIKELEDKTVRESQDLTLNCQYEMEDGLAVLYKYDRQVKENRRVSYASKEYKLVIKEITKEDVGEYRCVYNGIQTTFTIVGNFPKEKKNSAKMSFTLCVVKPVIPVKWMKDSGKLKSGNRIEVISDMPAPQLRIKSLTKEDEGSYSYCYGDERTSCYIKVEERPKFTKHLHDVKAKEKEILTLDCVLNRPTISVTWFKDEKEIEKGDRITISNENKQHSLKIKDISKDDAGEYKCECKDYKDIISSCTVKVEELPTFTERLGDLTLKEKDTLTVHCELSMTKIPVKWFKDNVEIKNGGRITISSQNKQHSLKIKNIGKGDAGEYRCDCKDNRDINSRCTVTVEDTPATWMKSPAFVIVCSVVLNILITYTGILGGTTSGKPYQVKEVYDLVQRLDGINKAVETVEWQQQTDKTTFSKKLEEYKVTLSQKDNTEFKRISNRMEEVSRDISTKADEKELEDARRNFEEKLDKIKDKFTTRVEDVQEELSARLEKLTDFTDEFNRTLSEYKTTFEKFEHGTNDKIQELNTLLTNLRLTVEHDLKSMLTKVKDQVKGIEEAKQKADELLGGLQGDVNRIIPNTFNKEALTMAFMVLIIFVFMLALWIYKVQNSLHAGGPGEHRDMNAKDVLQRIPRRVPLSNSICIVSFDEARQPAHEALVSSAFLTVGNIQTKYFVVRRHEHLLNMPKCKFYIMCTEFSERHVIIEEPGLGLGDLKRCTYEAIQRYGAKMIILYTRDPGSRNLGDQLYNHKIHCVSAQPELSGLRDRGRFFSTYDVLSATQKKALNDTVVKCLQ
ncbi:titin-like isoform X4 [Mercenaria mercenaria]|uniref:titin-like isoform X4 n=1 Tax=Mercenaria mercenaria TaxID=6596 RepID=UPI00234F9FD0|nr:titin-like isoform X4 [Mercenaria mercenaria]